MAVEGQETDATGIDRVDWQDKRLFEWPNELEKQVEHGVTPTQTQDILDFLATYARTHFRFEEVCMRINACPSALRNRDAHDNFILAVEGFQDRLRGWRERSTWPREAWLKSHIRRADNKLKGSSPQW